VKGTKKKIKIASIIIVFFIIFVIGALLQEYRIEKNAIDKKIISNENMFLESERSDNSEKSVNSEKVIINSNENSEKVIIANSDIIKKLKFQSDFDKEILSKMNLETIMTYNEFQLLLEVLHKAIDINKHTMNVYKEYQAEDNIDIKMSPVTLEEAVYLIGENESMMNRVESYGVKFVINDYQAITSRYFFSIMWALQNKIIELDNFMKINPQKMITLNDGIKMVYKYKKYIENSTKENSTKENSTKETAFINTESLINGDSIDEVIIELIQLEDEIMNFYSFDAKELTIEEKTFINHCIMSLVRSKKYSDRGFDKRSLMWGILAGETPIEMVNIISKLDQESNVNTNDTMAYDRLLIPSKKIVEIEIIQGRKTNSLGIVEADKNYNIDFQHMFATLDCLTNNIEMKDESEIFYDTLTGWGGDLLTFYHDLKSNNQLNIVSSENEKNQFIKENLGISRSSFFSDLDFNADIDAVNLSELIVTHNLLLSEAFLWYYDSGINDRKRDFKEYYGGEESFEELVFLLVNFNMITQNDIRLHAIEADELNGILQMFQNELSIDTPLEQDRKALYTGFIQMINQN